MSQSDQAEDLQAVLAEMGEHRNALNEDILRLKKELKDVKVDIKQSKLYAKDEQAKVDLVVEQLNDRIHELGSDIGDLERQKADLEEEVAELNTAKLDAENDRALINGDIDKLQEVYDQNIAKMKNEIRQFIVERQKAEENRKEIIKSATSILERLDEKERELNIRQQALDEWETKQHTVPSEK